MKAKLRKAQREKLKQSQNNNTQISKNESQSQGNLDNDNNNKLLSESNNNTEIKDNIIKEKVKEKVKSLKKDLNPNQIENNKKKIDEEDYKEQELSKIATMFNFEIDKNKKIINIKENDEYYDMRKEINELEIELEKTKEEYDNLIKRNEIETENQKEQIEELENELKKQVNFDIENLKKENIILLRDVNLLDKKLDSINALYQKEKYDMNNTIDELNNTIRKLKGEIFFVDDLKLRLKNLTNKEIPQDLVNSINLNFKDENEEIKDITDTSKFGIVKSKTGSIPITDILDFSSIDSKRSVKKLYI